MKLPLNFFELLRNKILVSTIVRGTLNLQRKGGEFSGLCPFHSEKTPSFTVNDQKRFYHCFGCGAHGDVIKFAAETQGLSYNDAAIKIAGDNDIDLPTISPAEQKKYEEEEVVHKILDMSADLYHKLLLETLEADKQIADYLKSRGITKEIISDFKLGYAPSTPHITKHLEKHKISSAMMYKAGLLGKGESGYYELMRHRLIFPIFNLYNKVIGFGGRALAPKQQPKYLNSPETIVFKKGESFYNENNAFSSSYKAGFVIVAEGYMDLIKLYAAGHKNVVASLGTAFTTDHLKKLWRSIDEVVLCFDGDKAGRSATMKALQIALPELQAANRLSTVFLPENMDPDDVIEQLGVDIMDQLLQNRIPLSEALWKMEFEQMDVKYPEDKAALENKLEGHLMHIQDQLLARNMRSYYKNKLWQIGRTNKSAATNLKQAPVASTLSARDTIIVSLYSLFIAYQELRGEVNIEFITSLQPKANAVEGLKNTLLDRIGNDNMGDIIEVIKDTGFFGLYEVLSLAKPSGEVADAEESADFHIVTWQLLSNQYQLSLLEEEYQQVVDSEDEDMIEKAAIYQQEIISLRKQIDKLRKK